MFIAAIRQGTVAIVIVVYMPSGKHPSGTVHSIYDILNADGLEF